MEMQREGEEREICNSTTHTLLWQNSLSSPSLCISICVDARTACLRAETFDVPSVLARTHTYIDIYPRIILGMGIIPPAGATKRGRTNLQATRSWQDMLCMLRAPLRSCTCLPRTPCTCRRWAPCTQRCTHSLRWRRLLRFRAHRCTRASSHRQTRTRQKISACVYVYVYVRICMYVCIIRMYIYVCICMYVSAYVNVCVCDQ